MVMKINASIGKIENMSSTVRHFTIILNEDIKNLSGQFINLSFEINGESYRKPYSISSSPSFTKNTKTLELCIKLVENGRFTSKLWDKKEGDKVEVMGPLGIFTLAKSNPQKKLVFIGTGTGIAPLRSMIIDELEKQKNENKNNNQNITNREILLIFGARNESDILYEAEFDEMVNENPNFKYIKIISKPSNKWIGRTGHVQDNFDSIDVLNSEIYMCGLSQMIDGSTEILIEIGVNKSDIHHEVFK